MSNFLDSAASAARAGVCQLLSLPSYLNDMVERVGFPLYNNPLVEVPNFWRRALCDTDAPPPNAPPFTGGQCQTSYRITITWTGQQDVPVGNCVASNGSTFGTASGPISFAGITRENSGRFFFLTARFNDRFGNPFTLSTSAFTDACGGGTITGINLLRLDGLPDDCGNLDPEYEDLEPGDVTINNDITYENNLGVQVTIPVVFVYARAQIDARANITIPFTLNLSPTVRFTGTVSLDGTVNFNFVPSGTGTIPKDPRKDPCDDIALPDGETEEDPTDSDQPDEPDREKERVIIGCLVTVTNLVAPRASVINQDENPDIYAPSLGHINFLCRVGTTSGGWTTDIQVKNRRHLIQCPWDLGAVAVRGTPQPGVTWELTPIYGYAGAPVEYVQ